MLVRRRNTSLAEGSNRRRTSTTRLSMLATGSGLSTD